MADLIFLGQFVASKVGATGLTVTVDIDRYTISSGSRVALVTGGSATEGRRGLYHYRLASADLALYQYVCTFLTADTGVDQQEMAALGLVVPDALVSSVPTAEQNRAEMDANSAKLSTIDSYVGLIYTLLTNVSNGVGAWTGTGVNTVLGAFKALLSKTASTPSDIGGTFDPATDSTEALRDRGDAAWATADVSGLAQTGADGDTLKTLSDQIDGISAGSGLTAQQTRDAMMLAPSAGTPAADSVDAKLDDILLDTGTTLPALVAGLDGAIVTVVSSVAGGTITVYVGDTWRFTLLSDELTLDDYDTLGLVVKRSETQPDDAALLYLRTDTGLERIGGAVPVDAANGELTKTANSFSALVHLDETQDLIAGSYLWWLKAFDTAADPAEAKTLVTGGFALKRAGLQAVE